MARKFNGIRALGNMTPEVRSAFLNLSRTVKALSAERRSAPLPNETEVSRSPGVRQTRGPSTGGRATPVTFGKDSDKPTTHFLQARGTGAFLYIAQDTGKVYIWDGTKYKSATFT